MTLHRYTLYVKPHESRSVLVRIDKHAAYRDHPHEIITDEPIPVAQNVVQHIVLDGGGRRVLRVLTVHGDEVTVAAEERTVSIPFRNVADEEADA